MIDIAPAGDSIPQPPATSHGQRAEQATSDQRAAHVHHEILHVSPYACPS